MKTNFKPFLFFWPDPNGYGSTASSVSKGLLGSNPTIAGIQAGIGGIQSILGFISAKRNEKKLASLQSPVYTPNQGILSYYNNALSRYNTSPTESALYKRQQQNIQRGTAQGIGALQDRRAGQAGIPALINAQNDAQLNAEVAAENQRNQRFGQLGQATGMQAAEDRMAFQQNQQAPFERKYNLLAAKAGAGSALANAGLSNIFGGLQNAQNYNLLRQTYGK